VGDPAVSPDGRWAAFSVTSYSVKENKGNSDLWLVPTDGGAAPRRLTFNKGSDGSPAWSPDGKRLAFISKRGDAPPQLYLLPVDGGEAEPLTDLPVGVSDPKWFPGGKGLAFLATTWPDLNDDWDAVKKRLDEQKNDKTQAKISDVRLLRYWDEYKTDGTVPHLFAVDVASRKVQDLLPGSKRWMDFTSPEGNWDISPDGREIAFTANASEPPYPTLNPDVFLLALGADKPGTPKDITAANPAADGSPRYSPDGRYLVFGKNRRFEIDSDFNRLARYDRKSGEIRELAPAWDSQAAAWTFTPDGQTVLFHGEDKGHDNLWALGIDGGTPRRVALGGMVGSPAVAAGGAGVRLLFTRRSFLEPAELMAVGLADGLAGAAPKPLTSFNAGRLAELDLGSRTEMTFPGAGGDPVQMFVLFPPGFDKAKKWPLVHLIHGGPYGAFNDDFHYRWNAALFASKGYVVTEINFHGSTGFGQPFADAILGNHGDKPFEDIMKATDLMLATGYIDPKRTAAAGGSYGGYMVNWILGHTDRFACLIDHAGVFDLVSQFASDGTWGRPNNYGASPWTDPERVSRSSPSRFAPSYKTPTLVLHGERDYRVPVAQGIALYGVLQGKGVPSRIVIFPDENHWVLKPQSAQLWWKEVFAWLEKYIGTGASPG
jgi:dipeptidyl aminopeptidase/acylaminoacyl peptidase